jgi:flagellar FliL protein
MAEENQDKGTETSGKSGTGGFLPILLVVILVPALSYAMTEFFVIPKIKASLAEAGHVEKADDHGSLPETKKHEATHPVEFADIVSNLSGSMKSRYIKVSFTAYSSDPEIESRMEHEKAKLLDATIGILSSLSLSELEEAGVKNRVRNELLLAFESVLHARLFDELYFSEFVVQ